MEISKSALLALPEKTRNLFELIKEVPAVGDFTLVGGTALALRLTHRLSEDLDFMTTGKLNKKSIDQILEHANRYGLKITKLVDPFKSLEFDMDQANIDDYGQNWRVDGVKLTFFCKRMNSPGAQHFLESVLEASDVPGVDCMHIKVASEACIFALKSQVIDERLVSRDLFDLQSLISTGRYSVSRMFHEAKKLGADPETLKVKLLHGKLRADDAPVNTVDGATVDITSLRQWFSEQINEFERARAAAIMQFGPQMRDSLEID